LKGKKQGQLYHNNTTSLTNVVQILGFNFSASAPRDIASGLPTGKSTFTPVSLYKEMDTSSPLLMQALTTNEIFQATITAVDPATSQYCYTLFRSVGLANAVLLPLFGLRILTFLNSQMAIWPPHSPGNSQTEA